MFNIICDHKIRYFICTFQILLVKILLYADREFDLIRTYQECESKVKTNYQPPEK